MELIEFNIKDGFNVLGALMFYIMFVVNFLYILAELTFNIVLLKVVSAEVSMGDIQEVEVFGRGLAAFGFTFMLLKLLQGTRLGVKRKIVFMSVVTVVAYPLFYVGQEKLVDSLAENSSPETRSKMGSIHLLKKGLLNGALEVDSVPYNKEIKDLPESKAFITNIALFMMSNDRVLNYVEDNREEIASAVFERDLIERVKHYSWVHYEVVRNVRHEFSNYTYNLEKLARKENQVSRLVNENYEDLVKYLKFMYKRDRGRVEYRGMSFIQYSKAADIQSFIKSRIETKGGGEPSGEIDVSSPSAMTRSILSEDFKAFNDGISAVEIKYDMEFPRGVKDEVDFINHPEVRKILKVELGALYVPIKYPDVWSEEERIQVLIENSGTIGANMGRDFIRKCSDPDTSKAVVKAMIIPPIALFLSLLFVFINLAILARTIVGGFVQGGGANIAALFLIISLLFLPALLTNKYTESGSYAKVIRPVMEHSVLVAAAVTWVMKFEPFVYKYVSPYVNEKNVL